MIQRERESTQQNVLNDCKMSIEQFVVSSLMFEFVCTVTASRLNKGTRIRTTVKTEGVWVTQQFLNTKEMPRNACVCTMCAVRGGCSAVRAQMWGQLFFFF